MAEVTPERMRDLATQAEALGTAIRAAQEDFRAHADGPVRCAGYRLDEAIGCARSAATELRETAADLDRIADAAKPGTCAIPWGVCPRHGKHAGEQRRAGVVQTGALRERMGLRPGVPAMHRAGPVAAQGHRG